ncbi:MAG TPA: flagellar filament capping protein FliD [Tepidisphaeraceae bacterium]|nr:flagellar filament capping protein FliD [Tepidisphaeraceae bacterium]
MARITSSVGLVSGINSRDIIDQLISIESRPKALLQSRVDNVNSQRTAYTELSTRLTSLRLSATSLKKISTFQNAKATTSDDGVITANASAGAAVGSYTFQVARLVTTQQAVSRGFADFTSAKVGPATGSQTVTIETGGGELTAENLLDELNGGNGVRRGAFRITDRSGNSSIIDVSGAVSLQDVLKKVNTSLDVAVRASLDGDQLVLTDQTGKTTNNFTVQDIGEGTTALDLGIVADVAAGTITGTDINSIGRGTRLDQLNDNRGVRTGGSGNDLSITLSDASTVEVSLLAARTVGDVIDTINTAGAGKVTASFDAGSNALKLTDNTGSGGITVAAVGTSRAAADLGLLGTGAGATLVGQEVLTTLGTVSLRSLNGGAGLTLGSLSIQNRSGTTTAVNLSGAKTVQQAIDTINAANAGVKAAVNRSGSGIQLTDTSGGSGNVVIGESGGTTAADLGLLGTFDASFGAIQGKNLQRQYVTESTLLSKYNGGRGVQAGKFRVTDSSGASSIVDLTQGTEVRLRDVISEINSRGLSITASINAKGDGLLLTDTGTGTVKIKVENVEGSTASDLGIETESASALSGENKIDGSLERTITLDNTDTLTTVQKKINDLSFGVSAQIINDGTAGTPYRLSISARGSGRDGRFVFDAGNSKLEVNTLVEAKDAAVFFGDATATQPLLVTSSKNQIAGVIRGVSLELTGTSEKPVTVSVSNTIDNVVEEITRFTTTFNELNAKIEDLTKFDTETNERGLLLGDSAIQQVQTQIFSVLNRSLPTGGQFRVLADVGIRVGPSSELLFDEDKFREAYGNNPDALRELFTRAPGGLTEGTSLSVLNKGKGINTAASGNDIRIVTRDGTAIDLSLAAATTVGDVVRAINTAGAGKLTATLNELGSAFQIKDNTTGSSPFVVSPLAGSSAAADLGISGTGVGGVLNGKAIELTQQQTVSGLGFLIEQQINRLIDPIDGLITRQNKTLEARTDQFESRIKALDTLIAGKRERLERQFSGLESALSGLQSQQQSLSRIQSLNTNNNDR